MTDLPNRIRELRKARGWTLQQVSDRVGCGTTFLSDLERGNRELSTYWMKRIAKVLKVQVGDLLSRNDNSNSLNVEQRELANLWERADDTQKYQLLEMARIIVAPKS